MYRDVQSTDGQRARIRALNLFWYVGSGGVTCAGYQEHVVKTYTDAFFKNINHRWALVTFFVPIKRSAGGLDDPYAELTALEETKAFIKELMPRMSVKPTE
jgi:cytosine/adenosine deaminase-related metal-dependent hydrolase